MKKIRADKLLLENGLVKSRQEAQRLILAGEVWIGDRRVMKSGALVPKSVKLRMTGKRLTYVSRGGLKLEAALRTFKLDIKDRVALDVGASTGGFTDCLLKHGARHVYAVDVGYGQIDWRLRQEDRVIVIERTNARYLNSDIIPEPIQVATIDVSFISVKKIIPAINKLLTAGALMVILIKPQFEVGKREIGKGGIVKDAKKHRQVIDEITNFCLDLGFTPIGCIPSPILGAKGNREFLLTVSKPWE